MRCESSFKTSSHFFGLLYPLQGQEVCEDMFTMIYKCHPKCAAGGGDCGYYTPNHDGPTSSMNRLLGASMPSAAAKNVLSKSVIGGSTSNMQKSTHLHTQEDSGFEQSLSDLNREELESVVESIVQNQPDVIMRCLDKNPDVLKDCIKENPDVLEEGILQLSVDKPEIFENAVYQNVDLTELDKIKALLGLDDPELAFRDDSEEKDYFSNSKLAALEKEVQDMKSKIDAMNSVNGGKAGRLDEAAYQLYRELCSKDGPKFMNTSEVLRHFCMGESQKESKRARRIMDRTAEIYEDVSVKKSRKSKIIELVENDNCLKKIWTPVSGQSGHVCPDCEDERGD